MAGTHFVRIVEGGEEKRYLTDGLQANFIPKGAGRWNDAEKKWGKVQDIDKELLHDIINGERGRVKAAVRDVIAEIRGVKI